MSERPTGSESGQPDRPGGLLGTVVRGAALSAGGYAGAQILNLVAYIVLARLLLPAEFGTYASATALLGFALLVTESGMTSAIVQRRDRLDEATNTAFLATLTAGVAFGLVSLATAPLLGLFFDNSQVTEVAAVMSGFILLRTASSVPDAVLQRRFSFVRRFVIEPMQVAVFGGTAIVCAEAGLGVWSLVIGQYAGVVTDLILAWWFAGWRPHPARASIAMWRELVGFGRHIFVATAIYNAAQQLDSLIVGRAFGAASLGQFRYGFRLASTPFQALLAVAAFVLFPAFSRIADERERFQPAFVRSLRWVCLIAFPTSLIFIPLGVPIAVVVFGDVWREAGYAAMAMAAYTAGGMVISVVSEGLKAHGRPDRLTPMHAVTAATTIALMLAAIPLGFRAVAAAISLGALVGAAYSIANAHRFLGVSWRTLFADIWPAAVAAVAMGGVLLGVEGILDAESHPTVEALALLALEGLIGIAIFGLVLRLIAPRSWEELTWGLQALVARLRGGATGPAASR